MPTTSNCPYCGKLTDLDLDTCPHCGGRFEKKASPLQSKGGGQRQTCPNCHALVQEGDIICVACGTNLLTGQKVTNEKKLPEAEPRNATPWLIIFGAVAVVVILLLILFAVYAGQADALARARRLSAEGRILEARQIVQDYLKRNTTSAEGYFELGRLYWEGGQSENAAEAFGKAAEFDPQNERAALLHALCLAPKGKAEPSAEHIAALEELATAFPDNQQAWRLLALAQAANENVAADPSALDKAGAPAAGSAEAMGAALALEGDLGRAEEALTVALAQEPQSENVLAAAGFLAVLEGRTEEAVDRLATVADGRSPVRVEAQLLLGLSLLAGGRFEEAGERLGAVARMQPTNRDAQFYHGVCQQAQGNLAEAAKVFGSLAEGDGPYAVEAAARLAVVELKRGDPRAAQDAVQRAEEIGGPTAATHTIWGMIHSSANNESAAVDAFKRALQADPESPVAHLEYGLFHLKRQDFPEALRELRRYLALLGDDAAGPTPEAIDGLVRQLEQTLSDETSSAAADVRPAGERRPS